MAAPLVTLRYASLEDVAQDLDMVIQSAAEDEWSWEGASQKQESKWAEFVTDPSSATAADVASMAGRITVSQGIALSIQLLSHAPRDEHYEAAIEVSAPTLSTDSVSKIKAALVTRSRQWSEDGIESLFLFDLLTTTQTLLADFPELAKASHPEFSQPRSNAASEAPEMQGQERSTVELSRALFWSHHLKAPSKLKDFNNWCPELRVWGVVRVGWPGYLCFEGEATGVDEIVRRVKGLQWHAIQLRVQHSWTFDSNSQGAKAEDPVERAILSCALAKGHPDNEGNIEGKKVRTGCQVIESLGELVERLKTCGLPQEEISEALGIKITDK